MALHKKENFSNIEYFHQTGKFASKEDYVD